MKNHICSEEHEVVLPKDIASLPASQRSWWRHVCAGCAYELGRQTTEEILIKQVQELKAEIERLQSSP
jgi:hypothetical protein